MENIVDKIMEIVRQLPSTDQVALRKELTRITLDEVDPSVLDVASHYIGIMNGIVKDDVRKTARDRKLVNARIVLTHFLYREGLTVSKIGQLFDKDHSTITHYQRRMDDALDTPKSDPLLMLLYNKFLKAIE